MIMTYHARFRNPGIITTLFANALATRLLAGVLLILVLAGCASTRLQPNESVVRDTTTMRTVQRLVSVAVPGDSAKLTTRVVYDEATHQFRPVTIFSSVGSMRMAFTLDSYGLVTAAALVAPHAAQVTVTDTDRSHHTFIKQTVPVKAPLGRFVKYCIWFTMLVFVGGGLWVYVHFFSPIRFL